MDRGVGDRVHRVPAKRGARPGEAPLPRWVLRPSGPSVGPGEEGEPSAG
ncbi:hypothetical protein LINPERPRIM_LOCUS10145 [Linum perenne]